MRVVSVAAGFAILASVTQSALAQPGLTGLGFFSDGSTSEAYAVSADGSTVTGASTTSIAVANGQYRAFKWTRSGGMSMLSALSGANTSSGIALSADGSVVVGVSTRLVGFQTPYRAVRWAGDTQDLGLVPGNGGAGSGTAADSRASALSSDGSVMAGNCNFPSFGNRACRWTSAGWQDLGALEPGAFSSSSTGISGNGSIIVGWSQSSLSSTRAIRWVNGVIQDLGILTGASSSAANAISGDGSTICGISQVGSNRIPFLYTDSGGMVAMSGLPAGIQFNPEHMNLDGTTIVGAGFDAGINANRAMVWTSAAGLLDLNTLLPTLGVNLSGWFLRDATGVSADGLTIVGTGTHNGVVEAWVATIPAPASAALLGLSCVLAARRRGVSRRSSHQ